MVLVDASSPDQYKRMNPTIERSNQEFLRRQGDCGLILFRDIRRAYHE
jgi:hypothetical protein